ncbi:hypothetical protein GCM10010446_68700 [Streptomyces enissocaesilis]|uniref:Uncharacterized protein n=1 Tax=Streptomyces enissocaesilis TaxID=332589 RepID=A0ABN3XNW9_9ACTN
MPRIRSILGQDRLFAVVQDLLVTDIRAGLLLLPFPYGYGDTEAGHAPDRDTPGRAANETTITG